MKLNSFVTNNQSGRKATKRYTFHVMIIQSDCKASKLHILHVFFLPTKTMRTSFEAQNRCFFEVWKTPTRMTQEVFLTIKKPYLMSLIHTTTSFDLYFQTMSLIYVENCLWIFLYSQTFKLIYVVNHYYSL